MIDKSKLLKLAWNYIKQGFNKSESFKLAWQKLKETNYINQQFNDNYEMIKKVCKYWSFKFHIDYNDLITESYEIFLKVQKKYTYDKIKFSEYLYIQLNNYLKMYIKKLFKINKRQNDLIIKIEPFKSYEFKNNNIQKDLVKDILEFCIKPEAKTILQQYEKAKVNKRKNITADSIKKYFNEVLGISNYLINNAFKEIKIILKQELI